MFDISFPELVLVCVVALLVLGPERLPEALRTLGLWLGRARRSFMSVKAEIEREIGMDEVRRQLHNETILEDLKRLERDVQGRPPPTIGNPADQPPAQVNAPRTDSDSNGTTTETKADG